jgi:hypothetical protein
MGYGNVYHSQRFIPFFCHPFNLVNNTNECIECIASIQKHKKINLNAIWQELIKIQPQWLNSK